MINTTKKKLGDYTFDEVGTFSIEQLANVELGRQFSPFANAVRQNIEETWASNTTTWATETRTWAQMASKLTNTTLKNLGSYTMAEVGAFSLEQLAGVEIGRQFSPIINTAKPV